MPVYDIDALLHTYRIFSKHMAIDMADISKTANQIKNKELIEVLKEHRENMKDIGHSKLMLNGLLFGHPIEHTAALIHRLNKARGPFLFCS